MSNKNSISYRNVGDYLIPNLVLPPEEVNITLGKWGMLHKNYLKNHKPVVFATLLTQGKLWQYLANTDTQAQRVYVTLVEQMKQKQNITEQLKEENQMEWVSRVANIEYQAREIVCSEFIFV